MTKEGNLRKEILSILDTWCDADMSLANRSNFIGMANDLWNEYKAYPRMISVSNKSIVVVWISMWFRWTFPRLRIDQLLNLEWKYLLPISLVNLAIMSVVVAMGWHF